jgi:hypothetical protein
MILSGMSFGDLRVCWNCRELWVEDDAMQEDADRCPSCGADAKDKPRAGGVSPRETEISD